MVFVDLFGFVLRRLGPPNDVGDVWVYAIGRGWCLGRLRLPALTALDLLALAFLSLLLFATFLESGSRLHGRTSVELGTQGVERESVLARIDSMGLLRGARRGSSDGAAPLASIRGRTGPGRRARVA